VETHDINGHVTVGRFHFATHATAHAHKLPASGAKVSRLASSPSPSFVVLRQSHSLGTVSLRTEARRETTLTAPTDHQHLRQGHLPVVAVRGVRERLDEERHTAQTGNPPREGKHGTLRYTGAL
jgi:hypothetical protein